MTLFAHRFLTSPVLEPAMPPGHYDESLGLWVNVTGSPVADTLQALGTRGERDRPKVLGTVTKADRDRDDTMAHVITKPAGERAKDAVMGDSIWGPLPL
jgi:hypothetical protein